MKVHSLLLFLFTLSQLEASRCLQALMFDGRDSARAQLINLEASPLGAYRATHNIPQFAFGTSGIEIEGDAQALKPSLMLAPALHFFWHAHQRKIITDQDVHVEAIRLTNMPPLRAVTLMSGDWLSETEILREQSRREEVPGSTPAIFTALRFKGKPFELIGSKITLPEKEAEFFVPKNLLTVSSAQTFTVGKGVNRKSLPWQSYPEYFDFQIPSDVIAFESGKASAEDSKQFPQMFQIACFIMLKEATALNHPFDKVINYVHSPDPAHHRLYETWGLKIVQEAKNGSGHRLYAISLEQMLELKRYDPTKYSERLALMGKYSDYEVPTSLAYRNNTTLKEMMSVYLDASFAPLGEEGSRIRIDDRSIGLYLMGEAVLKAAGISNQKNEFTKALHQVRSIRYVEEHPNSYLPEEFSTQPLNGNLFIQEASEKAALKDPHYLAKLFYAVAVWYQDKLKFLPSEQRLLAAHTLNMSVITRSEVILKQADLIGIRTRPIQVRISDIGDEHGKIIQTENLLPETYYELNIPFNEVLSSLQTYNGQATVQRGHWAIQNLLNEALLD